MSDDKKPMEIICDGKFDPVAGTYVLTVMGLPSAEVAKEFAIKMGASTGSILAEVMGDPAAREFVGGLLPETSHTGDDVPVQRVTASEVEAMIRQKMQENDTCPCPNCVARRASENKNRPDPNLRH